MVAGDLRIILLGEDRAHLTFVRRWLLSEGVHARSITERPVAADTTGDGGETYVRQQFAAEVQYYRQRANHQRVALIVIIDADVDTVARRQRQLDETLDRRRQDEERIALVVPRRNIETWIAVLREPGSTVDETIDVSQRFRGRIAEVCGQAAPRFGELLRRRVTPDELSSLTAVRPEIARLGPA